jgi:hypothetical protein
MIAGVNPLFLAIEQGRTSDAISIVEQGADLEALHDGVTPLLRAIILSKFEIALTLIRKGANIEALYMGMTPLQLVIGAVFGEPVAIALIEKGANLEVTFKGMTPLQRAIMQNDSTVAVALINKGANTETPYEGKTPLQRVILRGVADVISARISDDANIERLCKSGIFRETEVALALVKKNCVATMDDLFQVLYLVQESGKSHDIKALLERLDQEKLPETINPGEISKYVYNVKIAFQYELYNLVDALLTHKAIASHFFGQPDPKDPITHALNAYRQSYRAKQAAQQESCAAPAAPAAPLLG